MAKLTQPEKSAGFQFVLEKDWEGLRKWMQARNMPVNHDVVVRTLQKCMLCGDVGSANKVFRAAFDDIDPEAERGARRLFTMAFVGGASLLLLTAALMIAALLKFLLS